MPRIGRIVVSGVPHHITQRGNNKQDVFFVDEDRKVYLALLKKQADQFGLRLLGYCLMTNHVHLLAVPQNDDSLAKAIGRTHFLYSQYINKLHGRSGHLWQNRFYSCALDDEHLWAALAYIEKNPVRAKAVRFAWQYKWSSAAVHTGVLEKNNLLDLETWRSFWDVPTWKDFLRKSDDDKKLGEIRLSTNRGRPLGSDSFLSKLEKAAGLRLRPLPIGRPKKREIK